MGFPVVKNLPTDAGDTGLIPGSGRSPGEQNGNPLQYSCQDNPIDRGAWQAPVLESQSETQLSMRTHITYNTRSVPSGKLLSIFESEFLPCKIGILVLALVVVRVFHTVGLVWNISLLLSISSWRRKGDNTQDLPNWPFACIDFVGGKIKRDTPNENLELFIESLQRHRI